MARIGWLSALALFLAACGSDDTANPSGGGPDAGAPDRALDAVVRDSSEEGSPPDAGGSDATLADRHADALADAGAPDAAADGAADDSAPPLPARIEIASGQSEPSGIAVDQEFVYFANRSAGTIARCPRAGCGATAPAILASGQDHPISVAIDDTHLYWVSGWRDGETGAPPSRPVFRCPLPGCSPASIEAFDRGAHQPYAITVTNDRIYLAAWPALVSCPKTGCTGAAVNLGGGPFVSVVLDGSALYAALYGLTRTVRCPLTGCSSQSTLVTNVHPIGIAVDTESVYVADHDVLRWNPLVDGGTDSPRIVKCPLAGCGAEPPAVVESEGISPYALATYADRLYFTNITHGTVISLRK